MNLGTIEIKYRVENVAADVSGQFVQARIVCDIENCENTPTVVVRGTRHPYQLCSEHASAVRMEREKQEFESDINERVQRLSDELERMLRE